MSREDLEILLRYHDSWTRRDWDGLDALLHPEVEWQPARDEPDADTRRGPAEGVGAAKKWVETFDDMRAEVRDVRDLESAVLVELVFYGTPPGATNRVALEETHVFRLSDGKIIEIREYRTMAQALEAVGLP